MVEELYFSDIVPEKVGVLDGLMIDEYLGMVVEVVRGMIGINDPIKVGVAALRIQAERFSTILIAERYSDDCGDDTVAGWTVFVEMKRVDLSGVDGDKMLDLMESSMIRVVKSHNIAVRTLINDFYSVFVVRDGDVERLRNHMVAVWRNVTGHRPVMTKKPTWYSVIDNLVDVTKTKVGADEVIMAYEYMMRGEAEDLRRARLHLKLTNMKFLFYIRNQRAEKTYIAYGLSPDSSHPVVLVSIYGGEPRGCYFLPNKNVDCIREVFWWLTSSDEEYQKIEGAMKRVLMSMPA